MRRLLLVPLLFAALTLLAAPAQAQSNRKLAKATFKKARVAYDNGDYLAAADLFRDAYGHERRPQLLYNIAQALKEAGESREALEYFRAYLEALPRARNKVEVEESITELTAVVEALGATLMIQADIEGLPVYVDGASESQCTTPCLLQLPRGKHTVVLRERDWGVASREILLNGSEETSVRFTRKDAEGLFGTLVISGVLHPAELWVNGAPTEPGPIELAPGDYLVQVRRGAETAWQETLTIRPRQTLEKTLILMEAPSTGDPAPWTESAGYGLIGAGIASGVGGALLGYLASDTETKLAAQDTDGLRPDPDLITLGEDQALYANILYGLSIVSVSSGVAFLVFGEESPAADGTSWLPSMHVGATPASAGIQFRWVDSH